MYVCMYIFIFCIYIYSILHESSCLLAYLLPYFLTYLLSHSLTYSHCLETHRMRESTLTLKGLVITKGHIYLNKPGVFAYHSQKTSLVFQFKN